MDTPDPIRDWARARSRELATALATDPYVRSARLLGYSLRSQVRGFFHDPRHPAARRLLRHWFELAFEAGADRAEDLALEVEHQWNHGDERALAGAWRALRKEFGHVVAAADRAAATAPAGDPTEPDRAEARRAAFDRWLDDQST